MLRDASELSGGTARSKAKTWSLIYPQREPVGNSPSRKLLVWDHAQSYQERQTKQEP
jgi:hypothetical protein